MRFYLRPAWQVVGSGQDGVLLASESDVRFLPGPAAEAFVSRLKAAGIDKDEQEIAARGYLQGLVTAKALTFGSPSRLGASEAYYDLAGLKHTAGSPARELELQCLGAACEQMLAGLIAAHGIVRTPCAPFLLVATDDYLRPEIARVAQTETRPWLLARPVGRDILLGPLFRKGQCPCWFCLAHRLRTRRWMQASLAGWADTDTPPQPASAYLPGTLSLAAGWLAVAVDLCLFSGGHPQLEGAVLQFDSTNFTLARGVVPPRETCPHCGGIAGGARPPADIMTWANPVTGIVPVLHVTGEPAGGSFQAAATFYQPLPLPGARPLLPPGSAFGHGSTQAGAELCCLAEVLERASAVYRGNETRICARLGEIDAILPESLLLFSQAQYAARDAWNAAHSALHRVPAPFSAELPVEWTPVVSLMSGRTRYVPSALCYFWYPLPAEHAFAEADSNGVAAGPTSRDALFHAVLELIERDALALWWYNRARRPALDLSAVADPASVAAIAALQAGQRMPVLLDLTSDLRIPVYVAIAPKEDGSEPIFGCAAHPDAASAAAKAIRELEQNYFWCRQAGPSPDFAEWLTATMHDEPWLQPCGPAPFPAPPFQGDGLDGCLQSLAHAGLEAFALDMTRADFALPVYRVFVPGLRGCWKRFAPGRLYDVPVTLGWLPEPLAELQLNPRGCPL